MLWFIVLFITPAQANFIDAPQNVTSSPCTDRNHIFLAPGVLTAGGTSRTCVSRFYPEGTARMTLTLVAEGGQTTTAARELAPGDGGCLDITVPQKPNSGAELYVTIRYPEAQCTWDRRISLRIASGRIVVVHTERARYRPGDVLRIRAIVLKADLTPAHSNIDEIWLEGPHGAWDGVKIAQWLRSRTRLGLAQVQHTLDDQAPPGKWTVRARLADGAEGATAFWVGNYELPPFQLTVRHAPRILRSSERLVWTVCVRYPWSEAVEGMLVIRLRGAGGSDGTGIRTAVRLKAPRACHRHAAAAKRIGLDGDSSPDVVIADFSFQEEGTRLWQNTTVVSHVVDDPVTLEFLTKRRAVISPGLPYKIKVKAIRWDDKPASGERIRLCRSPAYTSDDKFLPTNASCVESITDIKGVARVMFTTDDDGSPYYNFQASLQNVTAYLQAWCVHTRGRAALGPLRADSRARTLLPLYLALSDITTPITVHFVVITRGGIIYRWGATTQCPITSTTHTIQTTRNAICPNTNLVKLDRIFEKNLDARNSSELDSLMERHLSKVMLPIKVSHQMCPDSHLIAYFYHKNELISASKHFELEECFANKVEATWSSHQTPPGSLTSLHLSTPGPALCALSVIDTTSKWAQPVENIKDLLMTGLRKLVGGNRNLTEHDAAGECFLSSDTPDLPASSIELMSSWLASAGIRVIGENFVRHCGSSPARLITDDVMVPRSDFSESWLWRLVGVGANGSVAVSARAPDSITRFEASAVCLAKTGIAISQPAVLQVFREFFIHASSPQRLKRGESTIVPYRIFNYLYQPLSIEVDISTDNLLEASGREKATVAPRSSIARRISLRAISTGSARLRIRASAGEGSASDEVVIRIEVDPEGVPVQEHHSALLCGRESPNFTSINEISWSWPAAQTVPGTETLTVWATGDTFGPLLADSDGLVQLPRGCGEQNMARLATNLLALELLPPGQQSLAARDHVARGVTRQLQYAHASGGFSAFGPRDPQPSAWLTAFCLRYLRRAYEVISGKAPVPPAITRAERWLASQQMENGCFRPDGHVFHHELQGGLNEDGETTNVALTAYIITSLLESSSPLPPNLIRNSLSCLRALPPLSKTPNPSRMYAQAVITYAFMKLRSSAVRSNEVELKEEEELQVLVDFLQVAKRSGEYVWWETGSLSTSVEATGYALLALSECPPSLSAHCARDVSGAARWLATQRSAAGGFISTQDTLIALEGLSRWRALLPPPTPVTLTIHSGPQSSTLHLTADNTVPKIVKLPVDQQTDVTIKGGGCALVQATRTYNTFDPPTIQRSLRVRIRTEGAFDCVNDTCFCAAVLEVCAVWWDALPPMSLVEVSLPSGYAADAEKLYSQLDDYSLLRRIEISPNSGKVTLYLGSRDGSDTISRVGRQCYNIHVVGPKARTKPAYVKMIDYYRPYIKDTQVYTIPEDCPSQISENTNNYHAKDNLFNKARSPTDSGEIVISHEYSFEDIPEGIPLDDPMYDNLIKKNDYEVINTINNENVKFEKIVEASKPEEVYNNVTLNIAGDVSNGNKDTNSKEVIENEHEIVKTTKAEELKGFDESDKANIETNNTHKDITSKKVTENEHYMFRNATKIDDTKETTTNNANRNTDLKHVIEKHDILEVSNITKVADTLPNTNKEKNEQDLHGDKLNDQLSSFHVIDSEKDLEFPTGIEGPIPAIVLPPKNFVPPETVQQTQSHTNWRNFPAVYYDQKSQQPVYFQHDYYSKPIHVN